MPYYNSQRPPVIAYLGVVSLFTLVIVYLGVSSMLMAQPSLIIQAPPNLQLIWQSAASQRPQIRLYRRAATPAETKKAIRMTQGLYRAMQEDYERQGGTTKVITPPIDKEYVVRSYFLFPPNTKSPQKPAWEKISAGSLKEKPSLPYDVIYDARSNTLLCIWKDPQNVATQIVFLSRKNRLGDPFLMARGVWNDLTNDDDGYDDVVSLQRQGTVGQNNLTITLHTKFNKILKYLWKNEHWVEIPG